MMETYLMFIGLMTLHRGSGIGILNKNWGMKLCTSHLSISEIDIRIIAAFAANSRNCDVGEGGR